MEHDAETKENMQKLHMLEHNLSNLLAQKQAFELELNETLNALEEIQKTTGDVYKVVGGIMLKTDKKQAIDDLQEKKKVGEMRLKALETQEKALETRANELKEETQKAMKKK